MKLTVTLPEGEVERVGGPDKAEQALVERFRALGSYKPGDKVIVLDSPMRAELESALHATIDTPNDLLLAARRLASVAIGEVVRPLSAGEAERVKAYAQSHGITYEVALKSYVDPLLAQFLEGV